MCKKYNKIICLGIIILIFSTFLNAIYAENDLTIYSTSAIAIDADTGLILCGKNENKKIYPASTTKILTAILAIEKLDLDKSVVVSKTALSIPWDSSTANLKEGEIISVNDLLYCLLLQSGNDAANVLAETVSGSISSFVKLMNEKVEELGCTGTNFANAHGYSDTNHYTTASDMAKIFRYCIQNETFVKIISTKECTINPTNKTNKARTYDNTNRLIQTKEDSVYSRYYKYDIGGKTGYTDEAGKTLVTFAKKDDKTIITAIFGGGTVDNKDGRYTDAINLFEYCFNNFNKQSCINKKDYSFNYINIENELKYSVELEDDMSILTNDSTVLKEFSYTINIDDSRLPKSLDSTINKDTIVGNINFILKINNKDYTLSKNLVLTSFAKYTKPTTTTSALLYVCLAIFVVLLLGVVIIKITSNTSSNSKRMRDRRKSIKIS